MASMREFERDDEEPAFASPSSGRVRRPETAGPLVCDPAIRLSLTCIAPGAHLDSRPSDIEVAQLIHSRAPWCSSDNE